MASRSWHARFRIAAGGEPRVPVAVTLWAPGEPADSTTGTAWRDAAGLVQVVADGASGLAWAVAADGLVAVRDGWRGTLGAGTVLVDPPADLPGPRPAPGAAGF
jgi:hypothetical protein